MSYGNKRDILRNIFRLQIDALLLQQDNNDSGSDIEANETQKTNLEDPENNMKAEKLNSQIEMIHLLSLNYLKIADLYFQSRKYDQCMRWLRSLYSLIRDERIDCPTMHPVDLANSVELRERLGKSLLNQRIEIESSILGAQIKVVALDFAGAKYILQQLSKFVHVDDISHVYEPSHCKWTHKLEVLIIICSALESEEDCIFESFSRIFDSIQQIQDNEPNFPGIVDYFQLIFSHIMQGMTIAKYVGQGRVKFIDSDADFESLSMRLAKSPLFTIPFAIFVLRSLAKLDYSNNLGIFHDSIKNYSRHEIYEKLLTNKLFCQISFGVNIEKMRFEIADELGSLMLCSPRRSELQMEEELQIRSLSNDIRSLCIANDSLI
ncbi:MAG: hypothetical protein MHMPM18_002870 [Marteilia pararefringens]